MAKRTSHSLDHQNSTSQNTFGTSVLDLPSPSLPRYFFTASYVPSFAHFEPRRTTHIAASSLCGLQTFSTRLQTLLGFQLLKPFRFKTNEFSCHPESLALQRGLQPTLLQPLLILPNLQRNPRPRRKRGKPLLGQIRVRFKHRPSQHLSPAQGDRSDERWPRHLQIHRHQHLHFEQADAGEL